jgi:hypothetical protein
MDFGNSTVSVKVDISSKKLEPRLASQRNKRSHGSLKSHGAAATRERARQTKGEKFCLNSNNQYVTKELIAGRESGRHVTSVTLSNDEPKACACGEREFLTFRRGMKFNKMQFVAMRLGVRGSD